MANRRMFSLDVVNTDKFLDMPTSTQALYFQLGMRADDDGFVASPKRIITIVGASPDDLHLLVAKGFVILFEDGIIVITHWKRNNYIQKDRYKKTIYQDKTALLTVKNDIYEFDSTVCIQDVSNTDTQVRLGKDSIGKDRDIIDYQQIADMYNATCVSFPRLTKLSEKRKKSIKARLRTYTVDDFKKLFEMAENSNFLKGQNDRNWSATFDWLITDGNMAKVLDGNYANNGSCFRRGSQQVVKENQSDSYTVYEEMYNNLPTSPDDPFQ